MGNSMAGMGGMSKMPGNQIVPPQVSQRPPQGNLSQLQSSVPQSSAGMTPGPQSTFARDLASFGSKIIQPTAFSKGAAAKAAPAASPPASTAAPVTNKLAQKAGSFSMTKLAALTPSFPTAHTVSPPM